MESRSNILAEQPVGRLLFSLSVPAIAAQLVTLLYNLVDRIYIGRMENGAIVMAAVGICAPLVTVISSFTGLFGRGGSPLAAIRMGKGDHERAEHYLGNSLCMLVVTSVIAMIVTYSFMDPLLRLFGASEATLTYAGDYLGIYIAGTLFLQVTVGMNYYITTQGFANTAMITTMLGGILNILLDPLFIFAMNLGVKGAALATVLSQFASFIWVLFFLFGRKNQLRVRPRALKPDRVILSEIVSLGAAPFFMSASEGVLHVCFNRQVLFFGGDITVSAMTILFSVFQFMLLPVEGVAQGSQPIIGYNYGAEQFARVRRCIRLAAVSTLLFTMAATSCIMARPDLFIRVFNSDPELVRLGSGMLRVYVGGLFILGLNSTFQQTYNSLGEGKRSFFFAFYRKVILLIPLIYILPKLLPWGVTAVVLAEPISDILTTCTNAAYFRRFIDRLLPAKKN